MAEPRLRTVEKHEPPYRLNQFPTDFPLKLGRELVYHLVTSTPSLEGTTWEAIFARLIGADWKPSNVGLDDVVLQGVNQRRFVHDGAARDVDERSFRAECGEDFRVHDVPRRFTARAGDDEKITPARKLRQ